VRKNRFRYGESQVCANPYDNLFIIRNGVSVFPGWSCRSTWPCPPLINALPMSSSSVILPSGVEE
jgi:hypothetical protein